MTPEQRRIEAFLVTFNALARASERVTTVPPAGAALIVVTPFAYELRFAVEGMPMKATFARMLLDEEEPIALANRIFAAASRAHNPSAVFAADCTLSPMGASPWTWQVLP